MLLIVILMSGCDSGARVRPSATVPMPRPHVAGNDETLRVKIDSGRDRVWVLSPRAHRRLRAANPPPDPQDRLAAMERRTFYLRP